MLPLASLPRQVNMSSPTLISLFTKAITIHKYIINPRQLHTIPPLSVANYTADLLLSVTKCHKTLTVIPHIISAGPLGEGDFINEGLAATIIHNIFPSRLPIATTLLFKNPHISEK